MKKVVKVTLLILCVGLGIFLMWALNYLGLFFSAGGRYDDQLLQMGVPFESQADIHTWNEGYSESDACPWGFMHQGLDFFFNDSAHVLAMAPGQVWDITFKETTKNPDNVYHITVGIRFNSTMILRYNFEPWTTIRSDGEVQLQMIKVKVGDWVTLGSVIADFLSYNESAHIHLSLDRNIGGVCPQPHFSGIGYTQMMSLIQNYHADWEMCYP